jgi:phosphopantetheinyl transferase (holo-ACP synthase)
MPPALHPDEAAFVLRRPRSAARSFIGGRVALRTAMTALGADAGQMGDASPALPILSDPARGARAAVRYVGSVSHKRELAVAIVARAEPTPRTTLGIDVEIPRPLRTDIATRVLTDDERAALAGLDPAARDAEVLFRFAAKEAIYKALDPWVQAHGLVSGGGDRRRARGRAARAPGAPVGEGRFASSCTMQVTRARARRGGHHARKEIAARRGSCDSISVMSAPRLVLPIAVSIVGLQAFAVAQTMPPPVESKPPAAQPPGAAAARTAAPGYQQAPPGYQQRPQQPPPDHRRPATPHRRARVPAAAAGYSPAAAGYQQAPRRTRRVPAAAGLPAPPPGYYQPPPAYYPPPGYYPPVVLSAAAPCRRCRGARRRGHTASWRCRISASRRRPESKARATAAEAIFGACGRPAEPGLLAQRRVPHSTRSTSGTCRRPSRGAGQELDIGFSPLFHAQFASGEFVIGPKLSLFTHQESYLGVDINGFTRSTTRTGPDGAPGSTPASSLPSAASCRWAAW